MSSLPVRVRAPVPSTLTLAWFSESPTVTVPSASKVPSGPIYRSQPSVVRNRLAFAPSASLPPSLTPRCFTTVRLPFAVRVTPAPTSRGFSSVAGELRMRAVGRGDPSSLQSRPTSQWV